MYDIVIETYTECCIGNEDVETYVHIFEAATKAYVTDTAVAVIYGELTDPVFQYIVPINNVVSVSVELV